ncbi:Neurofibromin-A [Balamuthia mandrillaris]
MKAGLTSSQEGGSGSNSPTPASPSSSGHAASGGTPDVTWHASSYLHCEERYQKMMRALCECVEFTALFAECLEAKEAENFADCSASVFSSTGTLIPLLKALLFHEFQLESVEGGKSVLRTSGAFNRLENAFIRQYGAEYIRLVLGELLNSIIEDTKLDLEISATRLRRYSAVPMESEEEELLLNKHRKKLAKTAQKLLDRIVSPNMIKAMPPELRAIAFYRAACASTVLDDEDGDEILPLVGAFVVLRLFMPAIVTPEFWLPDISLSNLTNRARRNLLLVAKLLQNLSNGVYFGSKEAYMMCMNGFIKDNLHKIDSYFLQVIQLTKENKARQLLQAKVKPTPSIHSFDHNDIFEFHRLLQTCSHNLIPRLVEEKNNLSIPSSTFEVTCPTRLLWEKVEQKLAGEEENEEVLNITRREQPHDMSVTRMEKKKKKAKAKTKNNKQTDAEEKKEEEEAKEKEANGGRKNTGKRKEEEETNSKKKKKKEEQELETKPEAINNAENNKKIKEKSKRKNTKDKKEKKDEDAAEKKEKYKSRSFRKKISKDILVLGDINEEAVRNTRVSEDVEFAHRNLSNDLEKRTRIFLNISESKCKELIEMLSSLGPSPFVDRPKRTPKTLAFSNASEEGLTQSWDSKRDLDLVGTEELEKARFLYRSARPSLDGCPIIYFIVHRVKLEHITNVNPLIAYMYKVMDEAANEKYHLVIDMSWAAISNEMKKFMSQHMSMLSKSFSRKYKKNLNQVFVVHPSAYTRAVLYCSRAFTSRKFLKKVVEIYNWKELAKRLTGPDNIELPEMSKNYITRTFLAKKVNSKGKSQQRYIKFTQNSLLNIDPKTRTIKNEKFLEEIEKVGAFENSLELQMSFSEPNGGFASSADVRKTELFSPRGSSKSSGFMSRLRQSTSGGGSSIHSGSHASLDQVFRRYLFEKATDRDDVLLDLFQLGLHLPALKKSGLAQEFRVTKVNKKGRHQSRVLKLTWDSVLNLDKDRHKIKSEISYAGIQSVALEANDSPVVWIKYKGEEQARKLIWVEGGKGAEDLVEATRQAMQRYLQDTSTDEQWEQRRSSRMGALGGKKKSKHKEDQRGKSKALRKSSSFSSSDVDFCTTATSSSLTSSPSSSLIVGRPSSPH